MTLRLFTGSLFEDFFPEETFPRRYCFGPLRIRTHSGAATCAWIAKRRSRACERSMSVSDLDSTATGRWDHTSSQDMNTT